MHRSNALGYIRLALTGYPNPKGVRDWIDPTHPQYDSLRLFVHAFHHLKLQS